MLSSTPAFTNIGTFGFFTNLKLMYRNDQAANSIQAFFLEDSILDKFYLEWKKNDLLKTTSSLTYWHAKIDTNESKCALIHFRADA